jgi:adenylate kinase
MVLFDSKVVGIYGVSGCGKSYALAMVQQSRPEWRCIDGSQLMREIVQEQGYHWHEFDSMPRSQQEWLRCLAAKKLQSYQGVTLVAGHGSFPTADDEFEDVFSSEDGATYDAIFYLEHKQPDEIAEQRRQDNTRPRPFLSEEAIGRWMQHEKELTRRNCANYNICFVSITELDEIVPKVQELISLTMRMASSISHGVLHRVVKETIPKADVFLLFDGDRTLCPQDTGELFVKYVGIADASRDPMKQIFQRHNDYCFEAFLEVAIWIERVLSPDDFSRACKTIAEISVAIHPGLIDFLKNLPPNVRPVLVSSGVIEVWRCVLEKNGLADKMDIIASSHIGMDSSAYIVDVNAKGHVVTWLKEDYPNSAVWAFGDSGEYIHNRKNVVTVPSSNGFGLSFSCGCDDVGEGGPQFRRAG